MAEGETDSKELEVVGRLFKSAEVIYFLGFGYQKTNIDRLLHAMGATAKSFKIRTPSSSTDRRVMGTALGMGGAQMLAARSAHVDCHDLDCLDFLRLGGELV